MQAYGSDRVRVDGERIVLSSRLPKGWTARAAKTLTSAEFPGTAVLWDEEYFEVVDAEPLPLGVRYTLERWRDHHAMRVTARYDEESETALGAEWRAAHARERKRKSAAWLAPLTGHVPAIVQERIGAELGVLPARLTQVSLLSELALLVAVVGYAVSRYMEQHSVAMWAVVAAAYLFFETAIRFHVSWMQNRPIGSAIGMAVYLLYWLVTGGRAEESPFVSLPGHSTPISAAPDERQRSDALLLREPLATLLPAIDQLRLRERYGYDYRRLARRVALFILIFAILGAITSAMSRSIVAGLVALVVAAEQLARLVTLRHGPRPSILGWVVRPLLRNLLL
jgi:hypothetical protein